MRVGRRRIVPRRQMVAAAKAVAHPSRLRILAMLQTTEMCVCQLSTVLQAAPSTVSGHLNDLRRSELVVERKAGKLVFYALQAGSPLAGWLRETLQLVAGDDQVREDAALVRKVQSVPIPVLTGRGLTLDELRRRRAGPAAPRAAAR